jgi:methyl-accepting chemotaxis protein
MRNNQPVTQKEVIFSAEKMIVSKTDLKGQITFVNRDFIEISGFTEAELLGQPHNLVRHPDMPPAAFSDLWRNLKAERPWTGMVKNRCKNGDHYWVVANVTPIFENGKVAGYMSVRSLPTRAQVDDAEKAYRDLREGRAPGMTIRDGQLVKAGFSWSAWFKSRTIAQRIFANCGLLTAGMLLLGALAMWAISESDQRLQSVYAGQDRKSVV